MSLEPGHPALLDPVHATSHILKKNLFLFGLACLPRAVQTSTGSVNVCRASKAGI